MIIDLTYRGDYTPDTGEFLQKHIVANDFDGLAKELPNPSRWPDSLPKDRFDRRNAFMKAAIDKKAAARKIDGSL